ncbi:MAG: carbohydrate ABC transporter permease [Clostridia bacterium]|nr:carbohydrate ABC transporter permease [Clostridia bacterium]
MDRKKILKKTTSVLGSVARWVFLISVGYIALYPIFVMISNSLMTMDDVLDQSVVYVPKTITFENFQTAFERLDFYNSLKSTLLIPILSGMIEVVTCAITAYGFARFNFREKNFLFGLVIATIAVPSTLLMIPQYTGFYNFDPLKIIAMFNKLTGQNLQINFLNTGFTMWLPSLFSVGLRSGVFIFIYRQFFKGLPKEFEEAAYVDGANPLTAFVKVIVPSSTVPIVTVTVFSLVWHWNEYYTTNMFLAESNRPLAVMLKIIAGDTKLANGVRMAGALIFIIPVLTVYLILQRKFIKSIDKVGIVG